MLALVLAITLLVAAPTTLLAQASPNMAPGYQQTYDRVLQQIRQIALAPSERQSSHLRQYASLGIAQIDIDTPRLFRACRETHPYPCHICIGACDLDAGRGCGRVSQQ